MTIEAAHIRGLKIVEVVPSVAELSSGPTYSSIRLTESLASAGASVVLATLRWNDAPLPSPVVRDFAMGWGPRRLGRSPEMHQWLNEQALTRQVDILHTHGMWQFVTTYASSVSRRWNIPVVYSPRGSFSKWAMAHGSKAKRLFWPLYQLPALRRVACFHATASAEYEDVRRLGFHQPVAIIPNGIDLPQVPSSPECKSIRRTLLFLGRLHPVKGLDVLLEAWRLLEAVFPEWDLVIAGVDGTYESRSGYGNMLKQYCISHQLNRVFFPGELTGDDKWNAYRNADLFVLPSRSENFGIVVAEALACGTPAVVTKGAPWAELPIRHSGWHVDLSTESLKSSLALAMSQSRQDLHQMGLNGRAWMASDYGWDSVSSRMLKCYLWLLGCTSKPEFVQTG